MQALDAYSSAHPRPQKVHGQTAYKQTKWNNLTELNSICLFLTALHSDQISNISNTCR